MLIGTVLTRQPTVIQLILKRLIMTQSVIEP